MYGSFLRICSLLFWDVINQSIPENKAEILTNEKYFLQKTDEKRKIPWDSTLFER